MERVARLPDTSSLNFGGLRPAPSDNAAPGFAAAAGFYEALYDDLRDGEVIEADPNPRLDDPEAITREIKSAGYFLNATLVAACHADDALWLAAGAERHRYCIVVAVEWGNRPEAGNPARDWLADDGAAARVRAAQIACILAGFVRAMGRPATAHLARAGEVDLARAALHAGVAFPRADGMLANPFMDTRFSLAAVTTDVPLIADRPLDPRRVKAGCRDFLGVGGSRPGFARRMAARRPAHLGPYPMEKLKRRDTPTTLLHEDEIPQVNSRALFYARGAYGDLGPKIRDEMYRWVRKHPMANAIRPIIDAQVPYQDGLIADLEHPGTADPQANARALKALCYHMGADIAGIGPAPRYTWYSHDKSGQPIVHHHRHALVILIDQGQDTIEGSTGDDWISGSQSGRAYMRGAEIVGQVARHIRSLGYSARAHSNVDSQVLQVPLLLLAGVGELSRIGEVVLNPFLGPRFKCAVLTTDMPLEQDRPVDFNLQDMCKGCRKCARECPSSAISFGPKVMFNGYEIWKPDVERCIRYRVTNSKGSSCGRCTKVCPFSHQGLLAHRIVLNATIRWRWMRRLVPRLDDWMGYGEANPVKKWWSDLEILGGRGAPFRTVAAKAVNARKLERDEAKTDRLAAGQKIAVYPASKMPPPNLAEPWPLDRAEGIADHAALETPSEAVARRKAGRPAPASYVPPEALPEEGARTQMVDMQRATVR